MIKKLEYNKHLKTYFGGIVMKKLLSILLSALILSTAFVIVPSTFAKSKNSATYNASSTIYGNPYSTVYRKGNKILSKVGNKEVTLVNISSEIYADFYVKGKTVFYTTVESKNLYRVSTNGKNKKKIANNIGNLISGYNNYTIAQKGKVINKIDANGKINKVTTLPTNVSYVSALLGDKLYCSYKSQNKYYIFNLKTNKSTTLQGKNLVSGMTNAYYINNNNLNKIDINGKVKTISKNIYKVYNCNNGATVVFSKKDKSGNEIFYRKTANKKANKLCTTTDIEKKLKSVIKKPFDSKNILNNVQDVVITKSNVCFVVSHNQYEDFTHMLLKININGGKLSILDKNTGKRISAINFANSTVAYGVENIEDFPVTYKIVNVK